MWISRENESEKMKMLKGEFGKQSSSENATNHTQIVIAERNTNVFGIYKVEFAGEKFPKK